VRARLLGIALVALAFPQAAFARGQFDPTKEFAQHDWVPIHVGPLDLSITKAVAYLMLGTVLTIVLGIGLMRVRLGVQPGVRQTIGEQIYEVAQTQIAEQGLPSKAIHRWFPYVASLFLFIFVVNLLGFIPLPLTGETYHGIPVWGIYAATSSISVTLALALLTFVFTHFEGIREWGSRHRTWRGTRSVYIERDFPDWTVLDAFVQVRNVVAHNLGRLSRKQLRNLAARADFDRHLSVVGITVAENRLVLDRTHVERCAEVSRQYVLWLDAAAG
jgi:hypothetical protein